jgi:glutathione S-transferase
VSRYQGELLSLSRVPFNILLVSIHPGRFGFGLLTDRSDLVATIRQSLNDEVLPRHLRCLEGLLEKSSTGWIAGTADPSIADFILVPRLQWLSNGDHEGISKDVLVPFPRILAMMDKLMNLPAVVEYYSTH